MPIALIGTFLVMDIFGFSINMVTLMALSLCVGLLIDDAIVVRENIVRHVQMGKSAHDAALDGTQEIGLAVLATTLSIVAVFLPIGFMGGIIGKFFHEFGITIVGAVLISMFVSFTLDPMLSSVWHDPAIHAEGQPNARKSWYDRSIGRVTGAVDAFSHWLGRQYESILAWSLRHKLATLALAGATFAGSFALLPLIGTEFVPKADYSETLVNFYTPVGSSLELTEAKTRQVESIIREQPEVLYTVATINTGQVLGRNQVQVYVRLVDRNQRRLNVDQMSVPLRQRLAAVPGITVTHVGLLDSVGAGKPLAGVAAGHRPARTGAADRSPAAEAERRSWPGGSGHQFQAEQARGVDRGQARRRLRPGPGRGHDHGRAARAGRRPDAGQLARRGRPELRRQGAPGT